MTLVSLTDSAELGYAEALTLADSPDIRVTLTDRRVLDHTPQRFHLVLGLELARQATRKRAVGELDGSTPETFAQLDRLTCLADASRDRIH